MRIAIIGSGISGVVAALKLHEQHEITVFEANDYIGGHTHTVDVSIEDRHYAIDTGFIVLNDRTYPNFQQLLDEHGVAYQPSPMSFSVKNDRNGWEYCGSNLNGLFAQRSNLLNPKFLGMIRDILRFNKQATGALRESEQTVGDYLKKHRFGHSFGESYFLAMGAAIWSCPQDQFAEFPIRFIAKFFENHGLLSITNRPQWYVIRGGSREYVKKFTAPFSDRVYLNSPVERVHRVDQGIEVAVRGGDSQIFDHVIFACHSDQALRMLENPTLIESEVLSCFPYEQNSAVLHTDETLLPKKRSAWAAWNYHIGEDQPRASTVTYNMNILQGINSRRTFCVTLNEDDLINPDRVLGQFNYAHPLFTMERESAQNRHRELIDLDGVSYCGAYWGNGFHEDGVNSALAVTQALNSSENESGATCTAASMKAGSAIVE
jgi:predicted NAD/FAD-binding protein